MSISKSLGAGETVVTSFRAHPKALIGPFLLGVLALVVGVFGQTQLPDLGAKIVWGLVALVIIVVPISRTLQWLVATYTFTNRRLVTRRGIIVRRGHDIPFGRVSDIESEVSLIDRIFGCGTLIVSDASTNGSVRLPDIPSIEENQRILSELLHDQPSDH